MPAEESEKPNMGRPPKNPEDKVGGPKAVTFTKADWARVNDHLADHGVEWMEFARAAIIEKIERDKGGKNG